ncbi:juvenile hormone esterase-like [Diabrotica virgifera virgifera]|uniref:Carboxylic ester hydrolase n=1 Tax=Diabrotica virgifera virgifera TaxID=50390 RepID=A0ABM5JL29_DIAVI|nr:juvenile hormone esterase-like [Diabrotica virgifera virgifera]
MEAFNTLQVVIIISAIIAIQESIAKSYEYDGTIVQLEEGKIRGHILKSEKGNDYYAFQEIPYAAPPIGENRFQLAKPAKPWTHVLDTTKNTNICYQASSPLINLKLSEDCLYINVYSPQKPGSNNFLPVLLWIHGGAFVFEAATIDYFGPKYLMDAGIVVVTFNYRLGPFGFVGTNDGVIPLNIGLKDQRFAMEWVNKNINLFGGNPDHVTIAGESSGSLSVGYHLIGPWENGKQLFHAAIMQSASTISGLLTQDDETNTALALGRLVDPEFKSNDTKELLNILQNAEANDIQKAGIPIGVSTELEGPFSYGSFAAFLSGNYKKVPVLSGFTSEEGGGAAFLKNEDILKLLDQNPSQLIDSRINMSPEDRAIAGNLRKQLYTDNSSFVEDFGAFIRYLSDRFCIHGICKQVELQSANVPNYFYRFSYKGELGGVMGLLPFLPPDVDTVCHGEDNQYLWDDGVNDDLSKFPESDQLVLHKFVKLYTNFVKFYNPTPEIDPLLDNVIWPPSEPKSLRYLNINETLSMQENPRQYKEVNEIMEKYMQPPFVLFG